jgi:hypothetical protein
LKRLDKFIYFENLESLMNIYFEQKSFLYDEKIHKSFEDLFEKIKKYIYSLSDLEKLFVVYNILIKYDQQIESKIMSRIFNLKNNENYWEIINFFVIDHDLDINKYLKFDYEIKYTKFITNYKFEKKKLNE